MGILTERPSESWYFSDGLACFHYQSVFVGTVRRYAVTVRTAAGAGMVWMPSENFAVVVMVWVGARTVTLCLGKANRTYVF
ncbi:hypothetical protein [Neisseria sp. CCUG12390]|uniref:hypothetical protein n=1 Tax=Neisseria sp. CCUG12390 TaxID=3392035 RepID=UPI003A0FE153